MYKMRALWPIAFSYSGGVLIIEAEPMCAARHITVVVSLCALALAQTGVRIGSRDSTALLASKNAVRRYCEMDAQGFRLASDTAKRMAAAATTSAELPDEWHGFEVISGFQIGSAKANARGVAVSVTYNVLGRFDVGVGYAINPRSETIEVQTVAQGDDWKVVHGDELLTPRISRVRTLKWFRDQLASEKDPYAKRMLQEATDILQRGGG